MWFLGRHHQETLSKDFLGKTFFWWQIGGRSCSCLPKNFSSPSSSPSIQSCSVFSRKVPWRRFIWSKSTISATWSEWHSWRDRRTTKFESTKSEPSWLFKPQILHFGTGITYQSARNWGRPRRFHCLALQSGTFRYFLYGLNAWFTGGYFSTTTLLHNYSNLTDEPFRQNFQIQCIRFSNA